MSISSTSIHHLRGLHALLEDLAPQGIALESHEYKALAFGNFVLVLGTGHKKCRFTWDGKESILTVEYQEVQNRAVEGGWKHDAYISVLQPDGVFAEIGSNAVTMLE